MSSGSTAEIQWVYENVKKPRKSLISIYIDVLYDLESETADFVIEFHLFTCSVYQFWFHFIDYCLLSCLYIKYLLV